MSPQIWTIGHSNRSLDEFVSLLRGAAIEAIADVRRFPGSRKHPQFGSEALAAGLAAAGIEYRHFPSLGGRRSRSAGPSPNTAWRVEAFNAYADYMQTPEFSEALEDLIRLATRQRTAMMCSEALPWRCHRRLIADALLVRGWEVLDILGEGQIKPRGLTEFASVTGTTLTYPGGTLFPETDDVPNTREGPQVRHD